MSEKLIAHIVEMEEDEALKRVDDLMAQGAAPMKILEDCTAAMEIVGKRFESGEYFLPHLIMGGEILKQISARVKTEIQGDGTKKSLGKVLMGTVEGDIHNIGKDIVTFLLEVNGFDVRDIGVDAPPQKFVDEIKAFQPQVVGMSGLLTLAYDSMKKTIEAIEMAGLRDAVKIMIGGAPTSDRIREYSRADAYGKDAIAAVALTKQWIGGA